ncbi:pseudouridine synthase [Oscillochloris trichoides DG-6]|uniref:RNA pseudouridylate synthase n=1 Tax=Oscillochloris trichoides DG-6 TaxID=765420 RepID=E1IDZ3_9CHLR|nr:RluA family pseudouridine synthase [Oscillochloris trichoides]EFO80604.1 pseudouridine synthase [Oscillochloris trichoides DG-6]
MQLQHTIEKAVPLQEIAEALMPATGAQIVTRGGAWLNGQRVTDPATPCQPGQMLALRLPPAGGYTDVVLQASDILYEDAWLIATNKRLGWYVNATPWDAQGHVLAALQRYLHARDGAAPPLHLAHQLDRDTSGVLLISREPAINAALTAAFAGGHVAKTYTCIVAGVPDASGEVRSGHGRSAKGLWRTYPLEEVGRELPSGGGRVKLAHTSYLRQRILEDAAQVQCTPHTGRTHQIRLHMALLGHPLLGDSRYGGPSVYAGISLPGHLLHAAHLALKHPHTQEVLAISSPLPDLLQRLLIP